MKIRLFVVASLLFVSTCASASTLTYSGTLPDPNDLFDVEFSLAAQSTVTMSTSGVPAGDFFPVLWLFDSTDTIQLDKDDPPALQDALITEINLPSGTYHLILSVFDQHFCLANTVCNGVVYSNTGWSYNGDFFSRSQNFAVTISSTATLTDMSDSCASTPGNCMSFPTQAQSALSPSDVPEPASAALLLGGGLSLLLGFRRARRGERP